MRYRLFQNNIPGGTVATVFVSRRRFTVAVYANDHPPPHVHVRAAGRDARFVLNCPNGPVELWDYEGKWTLRQVNEVGEEIAARLDECCRMWRSIHG